MNPYQLSLIFLLLSLALQVIASALGLRCMLNKHQPRALRIAGAGLSLAAILFAIHHSRSLELASHTGIYDLFQAALALPAALAMAIGAKSLHSVMKQ
jgi:hypothetical protein